jgi:type IV pilus assembly protein PilQ
MDKFVHHKGCVNAVMVSIFTLALGLGGCTTTTPPATVPVAATSEAPAPMTITAISTQTLADALHITIATTGGVQYTALMLQEPPRLIVDIPDATLAEGLQPAVVADGMVSDIEPLALPEQHGVRLLVHLRRPATYTIDVQEQHLRIALSAVPTPQAEQQEAPAAAPPPATAPTVVTEVGFDTLPQASVVRVQTAGALPQIRVRQRTEPLRLILDVPDAHLSAAQEKVITVQDTDGVVTYLQTVPQDEDDQAVHVIAYLRQEAPFEVQQEEHQVRLVIAKPTLPPAAAGSGDSPSNTAAPSVPAVAAAAPAAPMPGMPAAAPTSSATPPVLAQGVPAPVEPTTIGKQQARQYMGEKISLDFQNADIHDILRLIAEVSGLNIITGPEVKGTVTTRMMDVPWDQALDTILKINGLDQESDGNIIRIAPAERFITERQERLRAQQAAVQVEPTVTQIVPVSYAKADELKTNLEKLASERGKIFVDARTNTMIITDTQRRLDDMLALVQTLDRQTPQVMIESRIVEASRNFLRDLGIQLGANTTQTTDRNFPSTVAVGGSATPANGNFLVDLPAAVATGSGGAISFALAGANTLLNVRLSALESSGRGKIVTNPKIATLDNTEATIQSGRRIPYETVSQEGTQTEFADASISLRVTPHITADGYINMKIQATKNEADFANTSSNGVPTILTREASTEMLVKDGDTVVIGGLYQRTVQSSNDGVPGLSKVPILGWLFQKTQQLDNNDELLIFITPRIIKRPEAPMEAKTAMSY